MWCCWWYECSCSCSCIDVNDDEVDETDIAGLVCSDDEVDSIVVVVTAGVEEALG